MNLSKMFTLQKELNDNISTRRSLSEYVLSQRTLLALHVKLGELANATRCFKFWSDKAPQPREIVFNEYIDSLNFILSLGLDKGYTDIDVDIKHSEYCLTDQFLNLYIDIDDFIITSSKDHYATIFDDFLSLGASLGFSKDEIELAFLSKNQLNHKNLT